jgi:hypothetical protein
VSEVLAYHSKDGAGQRENVCTTWLPTFSTYSMWEAAYGIPTFRAVLPPLVTALWIYPHRHA